jgi:hypothetical protein
MISDPARLLNAEAEALSSKKEAIIRLHYHFGHKDCSGRNRI